MSEGVSVEMANQRTEQIEDVLDERTVEHKNADLVKLSNLIFSNEMANAPLVFDEFPATKLLLSFFVMLFVCFGVIDIILEFNRLGVMSLIISLFVLFLRCGERNRLHSSIFALAIVALTSSLSWRSISIYIMNTEGTAFEEKVYPLLILEFSSSLFLTLWLLLIALSGYSGKNQQNIYIENQSYRTNTNLQFTAVSAFNWYLISMGFEFAILVLYLLEESYVVSIIPFLSLLVSVLYVISKSRRILQYSEIFLPFIMLAYVILRMIYEWVAPNDYSSMIGAYLVTIMVFKQVVGLSILFIPSNNYHDMINDNGSYNIIVVVSYKINQDKQKSLDKAQNTSTDTPPSDKSIQDNSESENKDEKITVINVEPSENTVEPGLSNQSDSNVPVKEEAGEAVDLSKKSHSAVEEDAEANLPYDDKSVKIEIRGATD
ncbi:transmembrane domain-containing protein [Cryptosporidium canis]|uniref:Transmembrane domain-containing protein n=1 Tax=Cryptosporidium canis TaxID=195482 RepID=A0ABQ8PC56_9CRYT|nr:transmembrane domain-containing protein [Cryptosporidium canis]KAJ1613296.1 transmembrane domain-containing protein [Cryptosporidium canis]